MNKKEKVFESIKNLIVQEFGVKPNDISEDSGFHDDFLVDSLDVLELFNQVESEFDITISDQATQELRDVKSLVSYIENKISDSYFEE